MNSEKNLFIWNQCLEELKKRIHPESYKTWFEPTTLITLTNTEAVIRTIKGDIHAGFLEESYAGLIKEVLQKITGLIVTLQIKSDPSTKESVSPIFFSGSVLNKEHTFENFIVGKSNEFAHSAALAVAESPGLTKFNPLFIYGKSGLGKTHLIHAIGNFSSLRWPDKNIIYISSSQFIEQYIKSIEIKKTDAFNEYYKKAHILLIDDIQFLAGKQGTQETFFHIFNVLFSENKQIVITSDKVPRELDGLEDRLVSRFQSGLTVDIQPPNLETKIAIINKKAENSKINLSDDVIEYIATISSSNIREMEGHLLRLLAHSSIYRVDIDYVTAVNILSIKMDEGKKRIYVEEVIDAVAKIFNIQQEKIIKGGREKDLVIPRQIAMYLSRKLTASSLKSIGKIFTKDHSTIIHGSKAAERMIDNDEIVKNMVDKVYRILLDK
ncbi:MAG: hypothetical protein A2293_02080 [Elusimicrobia bacterium RIFOXYB2_FULL_49_7]|nr:MAG: hypothetical protein A2293_02080 [Elusimicrobia bacterium RIFOXYB2_FULL_49_7]